ncbi:MobF family relaxase [Longimycelium tulufanense]|nr:MobF family relaxase [Longimycelium tulufanense]
MTLHVLHAGDGYTYLTRQVATGDVQRQGKAEADPMTAYYTQAGAPPGQWVGSGCAELGVSGEVSEAQMQALFGEGLHPEADSLIAEKIAEGVSIKEAINAVRLGRRFAQYDKQIPLAVELRAAYERFEQREQRRPTVEERREIKENTAAALLKLKDPHRVWTKPEIRKFIVDELGKARQPVAGFDCVFTPPKSASLMWAFGDHEIRTLVEQAHEEAWRDALSYGEKEGAYTRVGAGGVAQVDTSGFVATAFQHRDSRAGDPNLHTHVAISNRVLAADGKWRTLDSRQMHRIAVSMSERYNARFEDNMVRLLGVRWIERSKGSDKRPVREIDGIPEKLIKWFSRRREQVENGYDKLVRDYVRKHGRTPPRSVQYRLAQQACLDDRPHKDGPKTMAEQVTEWFQRAAQILPGVDVRALMQAASGREPTGRTAAEVDLEALAAVVIDTVSTHRATWTIYHVRPEVERQLRGVQFASTVERDALVATVVQRALGVESVMLDIEVDAAPRLLQRANGESVFRRRGAERYTSTAVLDAEERLVRAARTRRGPTAATAVIDAAIARLERRTWRGKKHLNKGQRELVHHFVGSGLAVAVGIGPPGTGKSTAMRAVRAAWETTGGRVIGLAPSAAAAAVLGEELGVQADTMHRLLTTHRHGIDVDVRAGDMLLVDEAGMAGTRMLDEIVTLAGERGAVVRLVGDYRQLTAVEAGGALRLLHHEAGGVELTEVRRFRDPEEADALLAFRVGDTAAADWYADNNRLRSGVRSAVLDQLYEDWRADQDSGRTSIMISDNNETVRQLSLRAQADRRAAGLVEAEGVELHDGTTASTGDIIVTRKNKRRLIVFRALDYVKNGDLWTVERRHNDGRLLLRHLTHGGRITLPADYVRQHVELGYASTIHRSQGLTVDITRAHLSPSTTREAGLVALSRGIEANYGYLETDQVIGADEPETLPGDLFYRERNRTLARDMLAAIIRHEGAEASATEEMRAAQEAPYQLDNAVPQYIYGLHLHSGDQAEEQAEQWVRAGMPEQAEEILSDEAWPALAAVLHEVAEAGTDPAALLAEAAEERELDTAESIAQVMHYRVTGVLEDIEYTDTTAPSRPADLPGWVASPPSETPFPEYQQLPEYVREVAMRPEPDPQHAPYGGPGPRQLLLPLNTSEPTETAAPTPAELALFDLDPPTVNTAEYVETALEPAELGGPDPSQLLLVSVDEQPTEDTGPAAVDPAQLALFSATEPRRQTDLMDLADWLGRQAERIAGRVRTLGQRAADRLPAWTRELGPAPDDPLDRADWLASAGQVAAYREHWHIPDSDPALLGPANVRGTQRRARQWVLRYLGRRPEREPALVGGPRTRTPHRANAARPADFATQIRVSCNQWLHHEAQQWVRAGLPQHAETILADPAWPALAARLHTVEAAGLDPAAVLPEQAAARELDTAESIAQVLHYRVGTVLPNTPQARATQPASAPLTPEARAIRDRLADAGRTRREQKHAVAPPITSNQAEPPAASPAEATAAPPPAGPDPTAPDFWQQVADASETYLQQVEQLDTSEPEDGPAPEEPAAPVEPTPAEPETPSQPATVAERLAAIRRTLSGPDEEPQPQPEAIDPDIELSELEVDQDVDLEPAAIMGEAEIELDDIEPHPDVMGADENETDQDQRRQQVADEEYRRAYEHGRDEGIERD